MFINPIPFTSGHPDWIFWIFLSDAILFAWIQVFAYPRFLAILRAMFLKRGWYMLNRDSFHFNDRITLPMLYLYVSSLALLIYSLLHQIPLSFSGSFPVSGFHLYLIIAFAIVIFWAVKILLMNLLSMVFQTEETNRQYKLNILVSIGFLGIVFIPLLFTGIYLSSNVLLLICMGLLILVSLIRIWRGLLIGISFTRFPYFFLFVYLCSLELLPVVVLAKLVLS